MGKHANERAWREYDSWRTREPQGDESDAPQVDQEDYARDAAAAEDEFGSRFRPARRVRLFDEV